MVWLFYQSKELNDPRYYSRFAPDLAKDPFYQWLDKYHWALQLALAIGLFAWGGLSALVWGTFVRVTFIYHSTWLVNSATHIWGYQSYKTGDNSRNLWWVSVLASGEGWHNNHHAFPYSARHGLRWWEFDVTYLIIRFLKRLGLARNIKLPSKVALQAVSQ
jgi:stearoyl-CoA desaturase (delta-9 desaturase)